MTVYHPFLDSSQERVDGKLVGRDILYSVELDHLERLRMEEVQRLLADGRYSRNLSFGLHHNTDCGKPVSTERPASAYFTYDPKSDLVVVEWGQIAANGDGKLHDYLRKVFNYDIRKEDGMLVRSGHIAKLKGVDMSYALLDSLIGEYDSIMPVSHKMHSMVKILRRNMHIVLSSDGFVCVNEHD